MEAVDDDAAGDTELDDGCGVHVVVYCRSTLGGRGRQRYACLGSSGPWRCDAVERGACDWGGECEDAGEGRELEPCHLERWWS